MERKEDEGKLFSSLLALGQRRGEEDIFYYAPVRRADSGGQPEVGSLRHLLQASITMCSYSLVPQLKKKKKAIICCAKLDFQNLDQREWVKLWFCKEFVSFSCLQ